MVAVVERRLQLVLLGDADNVHSSLDNGTRALEACSLLV